MPRFNSLTTSLNVPVTPPEVEAQIGTYSERAGGAMVVPLIVGPGATVPVICDVGVQDPGGNYNAALGTYTVPSDGGYAVELNLLGPPATAYEAEFVVDGVPNGLISQSVDQINGLGSKNNVGGMLTLTAGQTVGFQVTDTVGGGFTLDRAGFAILKVGG